MRFRKIFNLFPGVKLNMTQHGVSTTLGKGPVSINVGPQGTFANVHVPGTPFWERKKLSGNQPVQPENEVQPMIWSFDAMTTFKELRASGMSPVDAVKVVHEQVQSVCASIVSSADITLEQYIEASSRLLAFLDFVKAALDGAVSEPEDNPNQAFDMELLSIIEQLKQQAADANWVVEVAASDDGAPLDGFKEFAKHVALLAQQNLQHFD
jgi:hypothetical protein